MSADANYREFATRRQAQAADGFWPGVVTPLLANATSGFTPAVRAELIADRDGVIGVYSYGRFTYNVVFAQVSESQPFVPRLICERRGRITSDTHYGFEVRNSRLWTESEKLNSRFKVTVSPFQDDNWLRQLFAPTFIDWLGESSPGDFSFELAYGALLCSVEADDPDAAELESLWQAAAKVAERLRDESTE